MENTNTSNTNTQYFPSTILPQQTSNEERITIISDSSQAQIFYSGIEKGQNIWEKVKLEFATPSTENVTLDLSNYDIVLLGETHDEPSHREINGLIINELFDKFKEQLVVLTEDNNSTGIRNPQLSHVDQSVKSTGWDTGPKSLFIEFLPARAAELSLNIEKLLVNSDNSIQKTIYTDLHAKLEVIINLMDEPERQPFEQKLRIFQQTLKDYDAPSVDLDIKEMKGLSDLLTNITSNFINKINALDVSRNQALVQNTINALNQDSKIKKVVVITGKDHIAKIRPQSELFKPFEKKALQVIALTPIEQTPNIISPHASMELPKSNNQEMFSKCVKQLKESLNKKISPLPKTSLQTLYLAALILKDKADMLTETKVIPLSTQINTQDTSFTEEFDDGVD
ncbi:MAG: hypothetical protein H0T62_10910 [Parachlamydiaceae bacterium]|nr:hypothetical protein [Parachlamydiaceae bacterium]